MLIKVSPGERTCLTCGEVMGARERTCTVCGIEVHRLEDTVSCEVCGKVFNREDNEPNCAKCPIFIWTVATESYLKEEERTFEGANPLAFLMDDDGFAIAQPRVFALKSDRKNGDNNEGMVEAED